MELEPPLLPLHLLWMATGKPFSYSRNAQLQMGFIAAHSFILEVGVESSSLALWGKWFALRLLYHQKWVISR